MKPSDEIKQALAREDWDKVESDWLSKSSEIPDELDYFLSISDTLNAIDQENRAATLLELLDDQLKSQRLFSQRLELIKRAGKQYIKTGKVFETVVESVEGLYAEEPDHLELLMKTVGLDGSRDETPKLWDKVERLKNLFEYRPGTIVAMKDKGVGTIVDVNLELQALKVDFESVKGLSVGFRAAGKMLEILPEGHVLRRKVETPEELEKLEPSALLQATLESYGRPMTGSEVKEAVSGIVPPKKWSSWWTSARKHSQVVAEGDKKQTYRWAKSSAHAADALWDAFAKAPAREQLSLLRRAGNQDQELLERMLAHLGQTLTEAAETDPALAFEVWQTLERSSATPEDFDPDELVRSINQPRGFLEALGSRTLREAAYTLIRRAREDWAPQLSAALLSETEPKSLDLLAELLAEESQESADKAIDQVLSQPRKTPAAFTWAVERAAEDEDLRQRRGVRMLRQILASLGDDSLSTYHSRLSAQCETGGTVPRILSQLDADSAAEAEKALREARGLEEYQRDPLLTALHLKFPELQKERESPLYATAEMFEAKRLELKTLHEEEIPANRKAIEVAREMGDLRENFEYKAARQRHEYLASRAGALNAQLMRAQVLDPATIDASEIRVGTRVTFEGDGGTRTITVLGPWESDPEAGVLSFESELAAGLLGHKPGDEVELSGEKYIVKTITVYND